MNPLTLNTIAEYCGGSLIQGTPARTAGGVSTDTRTIGAGDVFVALAGENFDGHDHLEEAAEKGASAVVVSKLPVASEEQPAVTMIQRASSAPDRLDLVLPIIASLPRPAAGVADTST